MTPRPYQSEANAALDDYLATRDSNPCIVIPTGGGKTPCMAWKIQQYLQAWPSTRILVLAHIRELLQQGVDKMRTIWPMAPIGIFSAGMKRKERSYNITYAGIQSIWDKAGKFDPWDLIFVDEAHRIPLDDDTMYTKFLSDAKIMQPHMRVVGWTATPYRLNGGPICHKDYFLNDIAYEANVKDLIDQGYLCQLRSKCGKTKPQLQGVHKRKGDYVVGELEAAMSQGNIVADGVAEAVWMLAERKSVLFFCVTIKHAEAISAELSRHGWHAPIISKKTPAKVRDDLIRRFTAGELRALCNINVLSEGFDAQRVDGVAMFRPTQSLGLYYQQVGRGLRLHADKIDCLICDFAGNIAEHGPIDVLDPGEVKMTECPKCCEVYLANKPECPGCGWFATAECPGCGEKQRAGTPQCTACGYYISGRDCSYNDCGARSPAGSTMCINCGRPFLANPREVHHNTKATEAPIISSAEPWVMEVGRVAIKAHQKPGKPPSLQVTYFAPGDLESHREWVCLEHMGMARDKARQWWIKRFSQPVPITITEAMARDLFLAQSISNITESITVRQAGRYTEVIGYSFRSMDARVASA